MAQVAEQLLTLRRQDEVGEQQRRLRMRRVLRERDRLWAPDQRSITAQSIGPPLALSESALPL